MRTSDLILGRDLNVVGIDYSEAYVDQAKKTVKEHKLDGKIDIQCLSVYDSKAMSALIQVQACETGEISQHLYFDAAYFSGSLSLMKDPIKALLEVARVVKSGGKIYITQTFQEESSPVLFNLFLQHAKPAIKYFSTVDFGQLVTNKQVLSLYASSGLKLVEHGILPGSVDNMFQSAYLSILQVP
jgi:ubiquinone/menaquinone biosynthesis C-methylase UbiE